MDPRAGVVNSMVPLRFVVATKRSPNQPEHNKCPSCLALVGLT